MLAEADKKDQQSEIYVVVNQCSAGFEGAFDVSVHMQAFCWLFGTDYQVTNGSA